MEETEGITYGHSQFSRYLEDLVGKEEVSREINGLPKDLSISLGAQRFFIDGCGLIEQVPDMEIFRSLFAIPIDNRKGLSGICKYFSKDYDSEGKEVNTQSFNVKGYPLPGIGLLRRFNKELVEEMNEYRSNERAFKEALAEKIIEIPYVILPIERKIIEAQFNRAFSFGPMGEAIGLSNHPKRSINSLKSRAYAKRADVVVVESTFHGLSGKYAFIEFQDKSD